MDGLIICKIVSYLDWKDTINFCAVDRHFYRLSKKHEREIWKYKVDNHQVDKFFHIKDYKNFCINCKLTKGMWVLYTFEINFKGKIKTQIWEKLFEDVYHYDSYYSELPALFFPGYSDISYGELFIFQYYSYDAPSEYYISVNEEEVRKHILKKYSKNMDLNTVIQRNRYELRFFELSF